MADSLKNKKKEGANFFSDTGQPVLTMKSLCREEDALVMKGVLMGAWDSKIYIRPREMVRMLGMLFKPSVIWYFISLPFILMRSNKSSKDHHL